MTSEEIKNKYSMRYIVEKYGLKINRSGFVSCPFHKGDRDASMKIYEDSYFCFGCGATGDIFKFVQEMDHVDFKEAFYSLGGTYEKPSFRSKLSIYQAEKKQREREKEKARLKNKRDLNNMLIGIYRHFVDNSEPLSDVWCDCYNALQYQLYIHENLNSEEVKA